LRRVWLGLWFFLWFLLFYLNHLIIVVRYLHSLERKILIPVGILPNYPIFCMLVPRTYHNSQERRKPNHPQFRMEHPVPFVRPRGYHKRHILEPRIIPLQPSLAILLRIIDHHKRHFRFSNSPQNIHHKPVRGHEHGFDVL
jgi:hypothetical protein